MKTIKKNSSRFAELRRKYNIKPDEAAELFGISRQSIYNIESNTRTFNPFYLRFLEMLDGNDPEFIVTKKKKDSD
ncbi:helix-turn-helix domain-containing protein [Providencia sp. wls1919]|nr:helix-turn-helix domain-containing protein [Providencia sp. wls1919]